MASLTAKFEPGQVSKLGHPHGPGVPLRVVLGDLLQVFLEHLEAELFFFDAGVTLVRLHFELFKLVSRIGCGGGYEAKKKEGWQHRWMQQCCRAQLLR